MTEERPINGWTVDTLHEHLDSRIIEMDRRYEQRFTAIEEFNRAAMAAADRAVSKAEAASERRFEGVNEFRAALADQQANLVARSEYKVAHEGLIGKIDTLGQQMAAMTGGKIGGNQMWLIVVSILSAAGVVISVFHSLSTK